MAINNFSTDLFVVTVNGRVISDWGDAATPFTDAPIDAKRQLRRGQGGNAVRLDRKNPGRAVSLYMNPGSADSAYLHALFNSGANITLSKTQIGTLEAAIGTEGVMINDASMGRGGSTISDDQYDFEFNVWSSGKGGI